MAATKPAADATEAGRNVYLNFGEPIISVEQTNWGDWAVHSKDARGKDNLRIVEHANTAVARDTMNTQTFPQRSMISEMRGGQGPLALDVPTTITVRDVPARKRTKPEPQREPEDQILDALDSLGAGLLAEFPEVAARMVEFDREVRQLVQGRRKSTLSEARDEFDALTEQGRDALEKLQRLEREREELREDRNRAITASNAAKARLRAVERAKPSDDEFPSREEIAAWQQKLTTARAEAADAAKPEDELQGAIRAKSAEIAILKSELRSIRAKRNAARERAGITAPGPNQADSEAESLRIG